MMTTLPAPRADLSLFAWVQTTCDHSLCRRLVLRSTPSEAAVDVRCYGRRWERSTFRPSTLTPRDEAAGPYVGEWETIGLRA